MATITSFPLGWLVAEFPVVMTSQRSSWKMPQLDPERRDDSGATFSAYGFHKYVYTTL